jgi:uncharacterized protein (DUF362 family)
VRGSFRKENLSRRELVKGAGGGFACMMLEPFARPTAASSFPTTPIFSVHEIPNQPFRARLLGRNHHVGVDALLDLMAEGGLALHRSRTRAPLAARNGLVAPDDVVLIKVNATWKYRGNTNSDVVRGLIQAILEHPDGFGGEIVVFENSQGWGSLSCDTRNHYDNDEVAANANRRHHSFTYVVDTLIADSRVSCRQLDPLRASFIGEDDHETEGYRTFENVSYPCFFTVGGRRIELREGIWNGTGHSPNLKLINLPVLKHHDRGGAEFTGAVKNMYGILSMHVDDDLMSYRHYRGLGRTCARMLACIRAPTLNIVDAIWVSHTRLKGHPAAATTRVNQLAASRDPLALDYWAAKNILYPIDRNPRHHPEYRTIRKWMKETRRVVNRRGGLADGMGEIIAERITDDESRMVVHSGSARHFLRRMRSLLG